MADNYCKCCGDGTPEYIIELNQQGAPGKRGEKGEQGYSPIVDFIVDDNEIKFTSTNENNITSTPNLYDYVLKKDGSNAPNPIKLNHIYIKNNSIYTQSQGVDLGNTSNIYSYSANIYYKNIVLKGHSPLLRNDDGDLRILGKGSLSIEAVSGNISLGNTIHITDNIPYIGTPGANSKIATIGDIPEVSDSKITINQGGVAKGSFTLNQTGDSVIELDSGGEITNPLKIEGATVDNPSGGTITYGMELGLDSSNQVYLDYTREFNAPGGISIISENLIKDNQIYMPLHKTARIVDSDVSRTLQFGYNNDGEISIQSITTGEGGGIYHNIAPITTNITNYPIYLQKVTGISGLEGMYYIKLNYDNNTLKLNESNQLYTDFTGVNNSIAELTTLADNTEASLNELKTDYASNKTEVAEELTTLGNQINTKASKTELNELADTKNDNIFDIGKFTVVGSPTITDEGVASGFGSGNYIKTISQNISSNDFSITQRIKINSLSNAGHVLRFTNDYLAYGGSFYINTTGRFTLTLVGVSGNIVNNVLSSYAVTAGNEYDLRLVKHNNNYSFKIKNINDANWTTLVSQDSSDLYKFNTNFVCQICNSDVNADVDLKNFSITVDGKEVFNGLMDSTKPIYDKITTTDSTLSTFQTDTDNNFSAVNSALNEKANLSDLANYVPLATYNALLARVEALEAEINGGNA